MSVSSSRKIRRPCLGRCRRPCASCPGNGRAGDTGEARRSAGSRETGEIALPASATIAGEAKAEIKPTRRRLPAAPPATEAQTPVPADACASTRSQAPPANAAAASKRRAAAKRGASPPKTALAAAEPPPESTAGGSHASVDAQRDSDGLRLKFSFAAATPAALFRRADTVWLVFDSTRPLDIAPIRDKGGSIIADASLMPLERDRRSGFGSTARKCPR